jgi:hypothetical protein
MPTGLSCSMYSKLKHSRDIFCLVVCGQPRSPEPKAIDSRVLVGPCLPPGAAPYFSPVSST